MSLNITDYFLNAILRSHFGKVSYTIPVTYYFGLFEDDENFVLGDVPTEHSGDSYARVAVTNNSTNFNVTVTRQISLDVAFSFPTASGNWGNQYWLGIWDAATNGNFLCWGEANSLTSLPVNILSGQVATYKQGAIVITEPS